MIGDWIKEMKASCDPGMLGMILCHNGVVRATTKNGSVVSGMYLTYDKEKLASIVNTCRKKEGIADVRVWINEGELKVGDDIMNVCVAGRFRSDVMPALQELLEIIKKEIVKEQEK